MIEVTGTAQFDAWQLKVLPPVEQVRPGLWSIPVPIPHNPLRYVLVYAFALPDGLAIVDAGWPVPEAWTALCAGLIDIGYDVTDVKAVLVTHMHADHHGLAGRVREASGAWIGMHAAEAEILRNRPPAQKLVDDVRGWVLARGGSQAEADELAGTPEWYEPFLVLAQPDRDIADGDQPLLPHLGLRAIHTPGHTPGHLCFHDEQAGLFLSGDHVLPRISPNIGLQPGQLDDPLGDFLTSLELVAGIDADEVLPAHEYRFRGLKTRADDIREHHRARLTELLDAVRNEPGAPTWRLAELLTWSRPWSEVTGFMRRAAVAEALAHLARLRTAGKVVDAGDEVDSWRATGE